MKKFLSLALAAFVAFGVLTGCKAKQPAQPSTPLSRQIYPDPAQAQSDLAAALKTAASTHKRVLIDFGGNWCGDCRALDAYLHDASNQALLESSYLLVHVNIGHMDANLDLARKYDVPLNKGVPALAVLDEKGALLFSQKEGQFEAMRKMQSSSVTEFLSQWKTAEPCAPKAKVNC